MISCQRLRNSAISIIVMALALARAAQAQEMNVLHDSGVGCNTGEHAGFKQEPIIANDLIAAAARGDAAAVRALLAAKADVNARVYGISEHSTTALIQAADRCNLEVVQLLLAARADVEARSGKDETALMRAAYRGYLQIVKALLAAGADVHAGNEAALFKAADNGHAAVVEALLAAKSRVNARREDGDTPLVVAVRSNRREVVKALLAAGANPNPEIRDEIGKRYRTLAHMATFNGGAVAQMLVEAGGDANQAAENGDTPLRQAVRGKTPQSLALVRALLAAHVDVEAGRPPNYKMSGAAARNVITPDSAAAGNLDRSAAFIGNTIATLMASREVSAEGTPLGVAARYGSAEIVQALLDARVNVNARQTGWQTPLMIAAELGRADVARQLLDAGADIGAEDSDGRTALAIATTTGHESVAQLLRSANPR